MVKYIAVLDSDEITLDIMGRKKVFKNNTEYDECIYIKTYPVHFKRIGNTIGYNLALAKPLFIMDPIVEFTQKEAIRKTEPGYRPPVNNLKLVEIDELQDANDEFMATETKQTEQTEPEVDVKFETEEE